MDCWSYGEVECSYSDTPALQSGQLSLEESLFLGVACELRAAIYAELLIE